MQLTTEVILCTYNGSPFVAEQLYSIINQTRSVDKISIYDDQSSDDTVKIIKEFVENCPAGVKHRFNIQVNATNLGYALNFVNAIERSTNDILFFCDQDDIWADSKVDVILNIFRDKHLAMVFSDGLLINGNGQEYARSTVLESYGLKKSQIVGFRQRAFELLMKRNFVNGAAAAVRRIAAQSALPLPCDMPHDYWIAIWCSLHGGIEATDQKLYYYRQHSNNAIGVGSDNFIYTWLGIWRHPISPRQRDLRIWKAVTERIATLPENTWILDAQKKLDWLGRVVPGNTHKLSRALFIIRSFLNGSYAKYASVESALRDIISLIK